MALSPRILAAVAAAGAVLLLAGPWLGRSPFLPEEARRVATEGSPWHLALRAAAPGGLDPEAWARLPSLLLAAVTALTLSLHGAREKSAGLPLLVALHPAVLLAARATSTAALQMGLVAVACVALEQRRRTGRLLGALLVALAAVLVLTQAARPSTGWGLGAATGVWGLLLGEGVPPWRLDLVLPALALLLPLAWLGSGRTGLGRTLGLLALLLGAGLLGAFSERPLAAASSAAPLVPVLLIATARGATRLRGLARTAGLSVALMVGLVGAADLHLERDVLDPARHVAWDEAARMTAVLATRGTAIVGLPDVPRSLTLYAPDGGLSLSVVDAANPSLAQAPRVLVVSHGIRGGLQWSSARLEESLERQGMSLRGELLLGALNPGLAALLPRFTGCEPPPSYLRIRRYER